MLSKRLIAFLILSHGVEMWRYGISEADLPVTQDMLFMGAWPSSWGRSAFLTGTLWSLPEAEVCIPGPVVE